MKVSHSFNLDEVHIFLKELLIRTPATKALKFLKVSALSVA